MTKKRKWTKIDDKIQVDVRDKTIKGATGLTLVQLHRKLKDSVLDVNPVLTPGSDNCWRLDEGWKLK